MTGKIDLITFEQAGFPVELLDERDWSRAIRSRRLARSTQVVVYRGASPPRLEAAEGVPELRLLFDQLDPIARIEPISGSLLPESPPADDAVRDTVEEFPAEGGRGDARIWGWDGAEARDDAGQANDCLGPEQISASEDVVEPDNSASMIAGVVALALVVAGFVAVVSSGGRGAAPADVPQAETYRVKEPANARTGPTTGAPRLRTLRRNTMLIGSTVDDSLGRTWVRVAEGEHAGLYVWTGNLERVAGAGDGMGNRR